MGKTTKQKLAGIYDPYIDTLGGGERYMFTIAQILLQNNYRLDLFTNQKRPILDKLQNRFNLQIDKINIKPDIFKKTGPKSLFKKYISTKDYDLFIYLSDGSIPFLFSKKNILHVQVPFSYKLNLCQTLLNRLKLSFFNKIIVNSKFTQQKANLLYHTDSVLLYPPIDISSFTASAFKKNIILSVGRFDNILNAKRQEVLIEAFKYMISKNNLKDWRLVLAGGSIEAEENNQYLSHLKYTAKDLPVEFVVNQPFATIKKLYSISKIYWHAAGFGIDEQKDPQLTEHFGMTVVEAMSAGLVPVVVNKGGLKEIVSNNKNGFLWDQKEDLISKTQLLIGHPQKLNTMSKFARDTSKTFSVDRFKKQFLQIIK